MPNERADLSSCPLSILVAFSEIEKALFQSFNQVIEKLIAFCYESPKKEVVFHAFEHLIQNLKSYNRVKI